MKKILHVLFFCFALCATAQKELRLKKGVVIDDIPIQLNKATSETYSLYLPKKYDASKKWPIVFVVDENGNGSEAIGFYKRAAEEQGYILAASNELKDTLATSQNIVAFTKAYNEVVSILSIDINRIYTSGFARGGSLASVIPVFLKKINGVISFGAPIRNYEFLSNRVKPYYFIGVVGNKDYNYVKMSRFKKRLSLKKIPNELLVFDGGIEWPPEKYIRESLQLLTISAITKGYAPKNKNYIESAYLEDIKKLREIKEANKLLDYNRNLNKIITTYASHLAIDSLIEKRKQLKKDKLFKELKRSQRTIFFNENLIKEEYLYALDEDVDTYNFNNLGWWNYQTEKINERIKSENKLTQQMGERLLGYVNALTNETVVLLKTEKKIDKEALSFLWMLKTIIAPKEYNNYIKIISNSAENEDFNTALFYLEELLKNGFVNREQLYAIEHTGLLKITPEYNAVVAKYLKEARYDGIEE